MFDEVPVLTSLDSTPRFVGMSEAVSTSTMNLLGTADPGVELPPFKLDTGNVLATAEPARSVGSRSAQERDLIVTTGADSVHMDAVHTLYTVSRDPVLDPVSVWRRLPFVICSPRGRASLRGTS